MQPGAATSNVLKDCAAIREGVARLPGVAFAAAERRLHIPDEFA